MISEKFEIVKIRVEEVVQFIRAMSPKELLTRIGLPILLVFLFFKYSCSAPEKASQLDSVFYDQDSGLGKQEETLPANTAVEQSSALQLSSAESSITPNINEQAKTTELSTEEGFNEAKDSFEESNVLPTEKTTPKSTGPLSFINQYQIRPIKITEDLEENVLVTHRYGINMYKKGDIANIKVILDRQSYDSEFNVDLKPIATMTLLSKDEIWLGLTQGEILQYKNYEWKIPEGESEIKPNKINAIISHEKDIFIGGEGIFKWDSKFNRLLYDTEMSENLITQFARSKTNKLYATGDKGIWEYIPSETNWKHIWKSGSADTNIHSMAIASDSSILLASNNGILKLSSEGVILERLLPKERVNTILLEDDGTLWAGTQKNGLKMFDGNRWFKAENEQGLGQTISTLFIDSKSRFWCGVDAKGVFVGNLREVKQWMLNFAQEAKEEFKPEIFSNACEAASKLLKGENISSDISTETIDGSLHVFFNGRQVCPSRYLGFRRADGTIIQLKDWELLTFIEKQRKQTVVPKEFAVDQARSLLLDSKDRIWIGTSESGVYRLSDNNWEILGSQYQLLNNQITAIVEDKSANIWIGSIPTANKQSQDNIPRSNLHLFNSKGHFHFGRSNGLVYFAAQSLAVMKNGTVLLGTNIGLSIVDPSGDITNIVEENGLTFPFITYISLDRKQKIFFAHQFFGNGVTTFDGETFTNYNTNQGLFSDRISSIAHDLKNRTWLIATNGSVGVYPVSYFANNENSKKIDYSKMPKRKSKVKKRKVEM